MKRSLFEKAPLKNYSRTDFIELIEDMNDGQSFTVPEIMALCAPANGTIEQRLRSAIKSLEHRNFLYRDEGSFPIKYVVRTNKPTVEASELTDLQIGLGVVALVEHLRKQVADLREDLKECNRRLHIANQRNTELCERYSHNGVGNKSGIKVEDLAARKEN